MRSNGVDSVFQQVFDVLVRGCMPSTVKMSTCLRARDKRFNRAFQHRHEKGVSRIAARTQRRLSPIAP